METSLAINKNHFKPIISMVLDSCNSQHSRRAYEKALVDFLDWYLAEGRTGLTRITIQGYKAKLMISDLSPSTINLRMCAIRKLAQEAADNGLIDQAIANGIARVKGVESHGVRSGNWLTKDQAQALLDVPDLTTLKGIRDRAILAIMLGAGLRRSEVAALNFEHVQQRDGRWVIVDLVGKGERVRTVPIPSWTKVALEQWSTTSGLASGVVFRSIHKGGFIDGENMTPQAVHGVVKEYAAALSFELAAHDLRRTFAKLAYKGGAGLDQIQLSLGHASIKTTERYLGVQQDLNDAPCDRLGLHLGLGETSMD